MIGAGPILAGTLNDPRMLSNTFILRFPLDMSIPRREEILGDSTIAGYSLVYGRLYLVSADPGLGTGIQEVMETMLNRGAEYVSGDIVAVPRPEPDIAPADRR